MNIAIIGYGRMGQVVEKIAVSKWLNVVSTIDNLNDNAKFKEIDDVSLKDVDVCIDFTHPDSVLGNIKKVAGLKKNMVVGTTGWFDRLSDVKKIVEENDIGFIYAPNFSLGVNLFYKIIENAAEIMDKVDDYDTFGYELHHNKKVDSPSGTAKALGDILTKNIGRKKKAVYDKLDRKIEDDEVHFASIRAGSIPGTHIVGFDSSADTIELKHTARNREGFALGAVLAAKWIDGKKGFFDINDLMIDLIK